MRVRFPAQNFQAALADLAAFTRHHEGHGLGALKPRRSMKQAARPEIATP
jgi:hypothetical protein